MVNDRTPRSVLISSAVTWAGPTESAHWGPADRHLCQVHSAHVRSRKGGGGVCLLWGRARSQDQTLAVVGRDTAATGALSVLFERTQLKHLQLHLVQMFFKNLVRSTEQTPFFDLI